MESITIKVDRRLAKEISSAVRKKYSTKTEFIRDAIRDKLRDMEKEEALVRLEKGFGSSKRKTTDAQERASREKAGKMILKRYGLR